MGVLLILRGVGADVRFGVLPSPVSTTIPFAKDASIGARTDGGMAGTGR